VRTLFPEPDKESDDESEEQSDEQSDKSEAFFSLVIPTAGCCRGWGDDIFSFQG
jgi:hypothetical protein